MANSHKIIWKSDILTSHFGSFASVLVYLDAANLGVCVCVGHWKLVWFLFSSFDLFFPYKEKENWILSLLHKICFIFAIQRLKVLLLSLQAWKSRMRNELFLLTLLQFHYVAILLKVEVVAQNPNQKLWVSFWPAGRCKFVWQLLKLLEAIKHIPD